MTTSLAGHRATKLNTELNQTRCVLFQRDIQTCQKELGEGSRSPNNFVYEFSPRQEGSSVKQLLKEIVQDVDKIPDLQKEVKPMNSWGSYGGTSYRQ